MSDCLFLLRFFLPLNLPASRVYPARTDCSHQTRNARRHPCRYLWSRLMVNCCIGHHLNNDGALWCVVCGSLVEGAMVGDYRLLSFVGNGSAADVYLAEQPALNKRKVVIKILHHSWSEARVSGFEREAAALALLSHPYILPIFDYGVLYRQATTG